MGIKYLFSLLLLMSSCTDRLVCTYELDHNLRLKIIANTKDISLNTYVITKTVIVEYNKKNLKVVMGNSEQTGFFVRQRKILVGQEEIHSLWLYNFESYGAKAINLDKMELLNDSLLSKGMSEWCLCHGFNIFGDSCEVDDCLYIESCNLNI